MTSQAIVTFECDGCGKAQSDDLVVETHTVTVDGKTTEVDGCEKCWTRANTAMGKLLAKGRRVPKARKRRVTG